MPLFPPMTRLRLLGIALLGLACLWLTVDTRSCVRAHRQGVAEQKASVAHTKADTEKAKGDTDAQHAQDLTPVLRDDTAAVAAARAKRDRDRAALHAGPAPAGPSAPAHPGPAEPQPVVPPVGLAAVDADSDALVAALDKKVADLEMKVRLLESADQAHQAEAQALRAELLQLRSIIAAQPTIRTWTVGAVYGTNQTVGGYLSKDLGLVQVGVDVVRRQIAGGQTTLEAVVHAGMRF